MWMQPRQVSVSNVLWIDDKRTTQNHTFIVEDHCVHE